MLLRYCKGTSIRQVPPYQNSTPQTQSITEKPHGISSGWMICNDTVWCWPITSSNIFINFDYNYSVKGGLKVIDCIVPTQSVEYWYSYGTCNVLTTLYLTVLGICVRGMLFLHKFVDCVKSIKLKSWFCPCHVHVHVPLFEKVSFKISNSFVHSFIHSYRLSLSWFCPSSGTIFEDF